MSLTPDQISTLLDVVLIGAAAFFPGAAIWLHAARKAKDELLKVMDQSNTPNADLLRQARQQGLKRAESEIRKALGGTAA